MVVLAAQEGLLNNDRFGRLVVDIVTCAGQYRMLDVSHTILVISPALPQIGVILSRRHRGEAQYDQAYNYRSLVISNKAETGACQANGNLLALRNHLLFIV